MLFSNLIPAPEKCATVRLYLHWFGGHATVGGFNTVKQDNIITNMFSLRFDGHRRRCSESLAVAALAFAFVDLKILVKFPPSAPVSHQRLQPLDFGVYPLQKLLHCLSKQTRKCLRLWSFHSEPL